jgi:hypothetical protein
MQLLRAPPPVKVSSEFFKAASLNSPAIGDLMSLFNFDKQDHQHH